MNGLSPVLGETDSGRPLRTAAMKAFDDMCFNLETSCEENLFTLNDLHDQMKSLAGDVTDFYSIKHTKNLLKERYGDNIFFAEVSGRKNVVGFLNLCDLIVSDRWYGDRSDDNSSERGVKDAAGIIASEIRDMKYSNDVYPRVVEIGKVSENNQPFPLPPLLLLFIQSIARLSRLKQVAIAQALIKAARPGSCLMPLLFGLSVQLGQNLGQNFCCSSCQDWDSVCHMMR